MSKSATCQMPGCANEVKVGEKYCEGCIWVKEYEKKHQEAH